MAYGLGLAKGLMLTLKHLNREPVTVQFPEEERAIPKRARTNLVWFVERCTGCSTCAQACPDGCILVQTEPREDGSYLVQRYEIDFRLCMYCGLCVEACPYEAIQVGGPYTDVVTNPNSLYRDKGTLIGPGQRVFNEARLGLPQRPAGGAASGSSKRAAAAPLEALEQWRRAQAAGVRTEQRMATITINGQQIEAAEGRPLVEVIKENGFAISNLCYLDGLPAYAGCRTCVVEIEGMREPQLSCTAVTRESMVVRTDTQEVVTLRQEVMAIILANHSDRCLTCHRVEHCRTGDICLRDDVVTHRCVTCSKNYRCELQTVSDMADIGRANIEPYLDEARSYYRFEQPEPDRANPFLEFDPQMCIICTRCVRACDDLRHTTAISLAGRGFSTRIAFGAGGRVDESNCDFCGACIDVCPTATLMEAPNKWVARPDRWVNTTCTECAMGCTIQMGVKNGRGVIVKPGSGNDVSRDQICVRGRFGYDQVARQGPPAHGPAGARGGCDGCRAGRGHPGRGAAARVDHPRTRRGVGGAAGVRTGDQRRQLPAAATGDVHRHASSGFQCGPGLRPRGGGAGGRVWQRPSAQPAHGH